MRATDEDWSGETHEIIGACIDVHRELGPGLLESAYAECLALELRARRLPFERQVVIPARYKGMQLPMSYRIDFIVRDEVVVELKAIAQTLPVHGAQLRTYLRLTGLPVGLLVNFHVPVLR